MKNLEPKESAVTFYDKMKTLMNEYMTLELDEVSKKINQSEAMTEFAANLDNIFAALISSYYCKVFVITNSDIGTLQENKKLLTDQLTILIYENISRFIDENKEMILSINPNFYDEV